MDNQEAFDRVCQHLFTMTERSVDKVGGCAYRGRGGNKCAVGALIPDNLYDPKMDEFSMGVEDLCRKYNQINELFKDVSISLLKHLQGVHDHPLNWCDQSFTNTKALKGIANDFYLKWNYE